MNCVKCGRETSDYPFHVLQVRTLHVRDVTREKRVQALGEFEDYCVCKDCAEAVYTGHIATGPALKKVGLFYGLMTLAGIVLAAAFWNGEGPLRLLGLGAMACGLLCLYGRTKAIRAKEWELAAMDAEDALYQCAFEAMTQGAPKKDDINDLTYIPVDDKTLARKNGDLMILYDLLPEIAMEAHRRIHAEAEGTTEPEAQ